MNHKYWNILRQGDSLESNSSLNFLSDSDTVYFTPPESFQQPLDQTAAGRGLQTQSPLVAVAPSTDQFTAANAAVAGAGASLFATGPFYATTGDQSFSYAGSDGHDGDPTDSAGAGAASLITYNGPAHTLNPFSGNQDIDATLIGSKWNGTSLTFSFPTNANQYQTGYGSTPSGSGFSTNPSGFTAFNATQQTAARYALAQISGYTNETFTEITETTTTHATIRFAQSSDSNLDGAHAWFPANLNQAGDVWMGTGAGPSGVQPFYTTPAPGNWGQATVMHELGHAMGLKHGHQDDTNVDLRFYLDPTGGTPRYGSQALPTNHDGQSWSLMTYLSDPGGNPNNPTFQGDGFNQPQTYMQDDIAALQFLYGANFNTNNTNTTYTFSTTTGQMFINGVGQTAPTGNIIYRTLWDGGGTDTYDLSNYSTNLNINLNPGAFSNFGMQLANNRPLSNGPVFAPGNIANALLFNGDIRSLIENAIGGSGSDTFTGNAADNTFRGNGGNDTIDGGGGTDSAVFSGLRSAYTLTDLGSGSVRVSGPDGTDTLTSVERLQFDDQTVTWPPLVQVDLDALNLSLSSSSIVAGGSTTVSYTVSNLGNSSSSASTVGIYRSADATFDASDVLLTTRAIGSLTAGASANDSFALTLSTTGTYNIIAVADYNGLIVESNESNNPSNAVQVTVTAPSPDLTASNVSVSDTTPDPGQSVTVNYQINNIGSATASGFYAGVYISADATVTTSDQLFGFQFFGSLSGSSSVSGSVTATMPASLIHGAVYYVGVIADDVNQVAETSETNNVSSPVQINIPVADDYANSLTDFTHPFGQVLVDASSTGNLEVAGDRDWFQVQLTAGTNYLINLDGQQSGGGTLHDPYLRVHDSTGALVGQNDDNGINLDSQLTFMPSVSGTYYLEAGAFADSYTGTYEVGISRGPLPPQNDFNADGLSDILWQNNNGQAHIWSMNGTTIVSQLNAGGNPGPAWHEKDAGDFNTDGRADILWQNDSGQAAIWLMNGNSPTSQAIVGGNPGPTWHIKAAGDFNGDGNADILWQNDNGQAHIWTMNGTGIVAQQNAGGNPGPSWHAITAGDFDGNGTADILWQNDNGQAAIWLMNGATPTSQVLVGGNPGPTWHVMAAGDFNGDGHADILWQNDNGQGHIWLMNGTTVLSQQNAGGNPGPSWHVKDAADFNGDGLADILWQNDNGQAAIWVMNGTTPVSQVLVGGNPGAEWHVIA